MGKKIVCCHETEEYSLMHMHKGGKLRLPQASCYITKTAFINIIKPPWKTLTKRGYASMKNSAWMPLLAGWVLFTHRSYRRICWQIFIVKFWPECQEKERMGNDLGGECSPPASSSLQQVVTLCRLERGAMFGKVWVNTFELIWFLSNRKGSSFSKTG